jgi:hypothetical protein
VFHALGKIAPLISWREKMIGGRSWVVHFFWCLRCGDVGMSVHLSWELDHTGWTCKANQWAGSQLAVRVTPGN